MLYDWIALHPQQKSGVRALVDTRLVALNDEYTTFHACIIAQTPCHTIHDTLINRPEAPLIRSTGTVCVLPHVKPFKDDSTSRTPVVRNLET